MMEFVFSYKDRPIPWSRGDVKKGNENTTKGEKLSNLVAKYGNTRGAETFTFSESLCVVSRMAICGVVFLR